MENDRKNESSPKPEDIDRRRDDVLRRMLKTPPKPHERTAQPNLVKPKERNWKAPPKPTR